MKRSLSFVALMTVMVLIVGGCKRKVNLEPPEIHLSEQECAQCRMLISDVRFAGALVIQTEGSVEKPTFDDINCVFDYLQSHSVSRPYVVYTHDFLTKDWIRASAATFVHSSKLETPMASHIAALSSHKHGEQLLKRYPGELLTYKEVSKLFEKKNPPPSGRTGDAP